MQTSPFSHDRLLRPASTIILVITAKIHHHSHYPQPTLIIIDPRHPPSKTTSQSIMVYPPPCPKALKKGNLPWGPPSRQLVGEARGQEVQAVGGKVATKWRSEGVVGGAVVVDEDRKSCCPFDALFKREKDVQTNTKSSHESLIADQGDSTTQDLPKMRVVATFRCLRFPVLIRRHVMALLKNIIESAKSHGS